MSVVWLATLPAAAMIAGLLCWIYRLSRAQQALRRQLAEVTQQGVLAALELQRHLRTSDVGRTARPPVVQRGRRAGELEGMEGTEELLADIRLLLDELGVEAGRTQSLTIERHEPISLVDRAQEAKSPFLKRKLLRYNRHDLEGMLRIRAALVSRV